MSAVLYLSAGHEGMQERHIYPKIRYDAETKMIGTRGGSSRMIYYTNSGMIPDQFTCDVLTRDGRWVGRLDEKYMEKLDRGDVFSIGGGAYSFCYRRGGKIYVDAAAGRPNIPTWSSERLPLSFDLARSILSFKSDMLWMMKSQKMESRDGQDDDNSSSHRPLASAAVSHRREQRPLHLRDLPPADRLPGRGCGSHQLQNSGAGVPRPGERAAGSTIFSPATACASTRGFSRMVAYLLARQRMSDICITTSDSGFVLSLPASGKVNLPAIIGSIREENCEQLLFRSLQNTSLLKSVFRINATRSFMILKSYKGRQKCCPAPAV